VAAYLAYEAERGSAPSTITRRCAAIRYAHRLADLEPPTASEHVRATLRGIRRAIGAAPARTSVFKTRDVSRHKSMDVLQAYVRDADLFKDHAGIGLL
jgi:hypothetical protein